MIITGIHIDGFGIFRDAEARELSPGLNVFFGENEAGKSTLLSFIPAILYGFPDGRSKLAKYPPLNGGAHGGSLGISDESLGPLRVARHEGPRRGPVEVFCEKGGAGDERMLAGLLSRVSEALFRSAYAFSLSELAAMETLTDADLRAAVMGASIGSGFMRLDKARKSIAGRKSEIFTKRARTKDINIIFARLRENEQKLAAHEKDSALYFARLEEKEAAEAKLRLVSEKLDRARRELRIKRLYHSLWPDYLEHQDAKKSLEELPPIPEGFPDGASSLLSDMERKIEELDREAADIDAERKILLARKQELSPDKRLLEKEREIRDMAGRGAEHAALAREARAAGDRAAERKDALDQAIKSLGPDFNEEKAAAVAEKVVAGAGFSRAVSEAGARAREQAVLDAAEQAGREVLDRTREQAGRCEKDLAAIAVPGEDAEALARQKKALESAPGLISELARAEKELSRAREALAESESRAPVPAWLLPALLSGLGFCLAACGVFLYLGATRGFSILEAAFPIAGLLLGLRLVEGLFSRRRKKAEALLLRAARERDLADAEQARQDLDDELGRLLASCGLAPDRRNPAAIEDRRAGLDGGLAAWQAQGRARESLDNARTGLSREEQRAREREQRREEFNRELSSWLSSLGLSPELSPSEAGDVLARVEKAHVLGGEIRAAVQARSRAADKAGAILEEAGKLFAELLRPLPGAENLERRLAGLLADLDAACQARAQAAALDLSLEPLAAKLLDRKKRKRDWEEKRAALFAAAGTGEPHAFAALCRVQEQGAEFAGRMEAAAAGLRKLSGRADLKALVRELSPWTLPGLEEEIRALESEASGLEEQREGLVRRSAELGSEAGRLAVDETAGRLRNEKQALLSELSAKSRRWAVLAVAEKLLDAAVARFEKDHQPRVIRQAGSLFSEISGGRYQGLVLSPGANGEALPCAVTPSGKRKPPEALSRGTAEQLYLCLRLAYAAGAETPAARLPIIMDDVLVNFDAGRAAAAARAIARTSRESQVLFFTCHEAAVRDLAAAGLPMARFQIENGSIIRL